MKKLFFLMALLLAVCGTVHAQYMLKVQLKDGSHELFEIDCTDNVNWEQDWRDPDRVFMMVEGRQVGTQSRSGIGYPTSMIEEVTIVGREPVAPGEEPSTYEVDEQTLSVNTVNYSIEFGPCVIDGKKTLTVNRIDNPKAPEDLEDGVTYMNAYDFDLEGIHDLKGVVEIRFPASKRCYAAYLNEETGEWDPVLSYYDSATSEMVIISDHLSTFTVFDVKNEHTRTAYLKYNAFDPETPADMEKVIETLAKIAESDDPTYAAIEAYANNEYFWFGIGVTIGSPVLVTLGIDSKIVERYSKLVGKIGTAWSILQFANTLRSDNETAKAVGATKLAFDLVLKPALENKLYAGNFLFPACMTAIAVLEFEINWFGTTVHEAATTLYEDAYKRYFRPNSGYPSKSGYGYRNAEQWYELINGFFTDRDLVPSDMTEGIEKLVTEYVNQPWNDTDGFTWAISDSRGWWPFWVEISDNDRRVIAENHRKELYTGMLKSVIQNINRKYLCKTKAKYDEVYGEYVKMMNKVVNLKFKDSSVGEGEKSKFAGCKIRFAQMPSTILDPEKWECVIADNGDALMQFRLYPYLSERFKPELEVVDENDGIVGNIDIEGIKDVGKNYEAVFDLSNEEDMALEDKWIITLDPVEPWVGTPTVSGPVKWGHIVFPPDSKVFEKEARGVVPGDVFNIYEGIVEAFAKRTLSFDEEGNFTLQNQGLTMSGHFNARTGLGTGKFTLKANSHGFGFVTENQAFDDWFAGTVAFNEGKDYVAKYWTNMKEFDADYSVSGTLDIQYSDLVKRYSVHLDGIGTFNFNGKFYACGNDYYWETVDGKIVFKYHSKNMDLDTMYINDGTITFSPTLIFE